ncbi:MAG: plasmid replication protein, CyRepA1 family, partial [Xenococcus sp. (in: cyanobacteria)]
MSKWNRLGKHRACPVCGGERKDCRSLDLANGITQYHCRTDNPNPDFELKKPDQLGFGIYFEKAELDAQSQQQKEDWIRQRQAEKKAREEREAKEYAEGLPVELRDREFRKLLSQLSLNPNHRADLERRGLTPEQIEKGMFRSVSKDGTFLNTPISQYLPGAWDWGKSFKSPVDGYLCPILNDNGLIIGGQVRVDGGGYVWLKTKKSSHLQNGELPITAHITEGDKDLRLVEGILKPQVAHCRRGQTYIGAAGGNFANSPQQIKQYIDYVQPQKIILCPDAGSRANKNVLRQYRAIANLLNSWGHELWGESWGQADSKDNCDVDEIDPNTPTNIIPFSEWDVDKPKERLWRNSPTPENELARQDNWFSQFRASLKTWQKQLNTTTPAEAQTISFYNTPTQLLANKLGETLIGCDSSGDFLTNKNALLKFLTDHDKTVPLRLYPSVGYQSNKALSYYKKLGEWLTNKGYQLEVGWYEQWHEKSPALLDFISSGDEIKYLSWPEFLDKNRYSKLCYKRNKEFTANIEYDQQYLDGEEIAKQIIQPRSLTAIKSPMGTGKTVLIGKIKEQFPDKGSFLIAHRNSLLQQSCKELGFTHMRFEDAYHLTRRPGTHLAFCPDSITRIDHKDLENRIVYLDEISSILPHILIGATCKKHRKHIIDKFTYMLRHAFAVVSLDANQKNWEVDHLLKLGQFDISTKIQNIYEKKPLKITFYNGTEKNPNDFLPVVVDIKRNYINGKTQVICSDSQNFTEFLHQYLGGKDNKEIIRIDGQTISEDWIRKLIKNPNSIAALGCKVLIYSPTMDTGVSITLANYFNAAYSLNFHLGAEAFSQLPGRIRDTEVPWTHWSKQFLGSDDDGIRSSDPEKVVLHLLTSVFTDDKISIPGLSEEDR